MRDMNDKIRRVTLDGLTIHPATTTDAVVHPTIRTSVSKLIDTYNVTNLFPNSGVDNGNKYNLSIAITTLSRNLFEEQKVPGVVLKFLSINNSLESYTFTGLGSFNNSFYWKKSSESGGGGGGGVEEAPIDGVSYVRNNGKWAALSGGNVVVDSELSATSINPVQNRVISNRIFKIEDQVFPLKISVTGGGGLYEKGTSQTVILKWTVKKGDELVVPDSTTINDQPVIGSEKIFEGVRNSTTYVIKVSLEGKNAQTSTSVSFIAPMYFGFDIKSSVGEGLVITSLGKQPLKTSPSGKYTLNNSSGGNYLWLCVPGSMNITSVTSGGFEVPMNKPETGSTQVDTYKCYRSSSTINSGEMKIEIK